MENIDVAVFIKNAFMFEVDPARLLGRSRRDSVSMLSTRTADRESWPQTNTCGRELSHLFFSSRDDHKCIENSPDTHTRLDQSSKI